MIARMWHGRIRAKDADEYRRYIEGTGLLDYRNCRGNRGALMLIRPSGDEAEVVTLSLWDSYDDIKIFAGDDIAKARYYPKDEQYLLEFEPTVRHFDAVGEIDALKILSGNTRP
ncbi:MAG: antibiotic biosynthesis monooxygenase [Candidatus Eremiobacteraeota bacterium]|nr:antibiotic biosynthesis monooxygenase [Candidatus Eremiobacteraeota bacterium]